MKDRWPAAFDVARLMGDVKARLAKMPRKYRSQAALEGAVGISRGTISLHLGPRLPERMSADHAARWMRWLGHYDIREYMKEDR